MSHNAAAPRCRSIFKGDKNRPESEQYTRIWIALINRMERNKQVLAGAGCAEQRSSAGYREPLL